MTKLTKSQRAARFDAFCSNENHFVAVDFNDPRAVAIREAAAERNAHKQIVHAKRETETAAQAAAFEIGQTVYRTGRRALGFGTITAISETTVSVDFGGKVSKFIASAISAA